MDGELVPPASGQYIDNFDPAIGKVYSLVPDSDKRDVEAAVTATGNAFPAWSTTPTEERSRILFRIADLVERDLEKFVLAESIDNGKPVEQARNLDIPRAVSNLRFFASAITQFATEAHAMENAVINYTLRSPIGIAG